MPLRPQEVVSAPRLVDWRVIDSLVVSLQNMRSARAACRKTKAKTRRAISTVVIVTFQRSDTVVEKIKLSKSTNGLEIATRNDNADARPAGFLGTVLRNSRHAVTSFKVWASGSVRGCACSPRLRVHPSQIAENTQFRGFPWKLAA
jgi:hypothetical protein